MIRKIIICLFLCAFTALYAAGNDYFNIELTLEPTLENYNLPRGATLQWARDIGQGFTYGLSLRMMVKDYTSLWGLVGWEHRIKGDLSIPIYGGYGLKIKDISLNPETTDGVKPFINLKSGIKWQFDKQWCYTLFGIYDINIESGDEKRFLTSLGITYIY